MKQEPKAKWVEVEMVDGLPVGRIMAWAPTHEALANMRQLSIVQRTGRWAAGSTLGFNPTEDVLVFPVEPR